MLPEEVIQWGERAGAKKDQLFAQPGTHPCEERDDDDAPPALELLNQRNRACVTGDEKGRIVVPAVGIAERIRGEGDVNALDLPPMFGPRMM